MKINKLPRFLFQVLTSGIFCFLLLACSIASAQFEQDPVSLALSSHHAPSIVQLEELAGGKEELISKLLVFRTLEKPPFLAIRSEKILLNYADRNDVIEALEQDMMTPNFSGLARVIAINIDKVPSSNARQRLARAAVSRAELDVDFKTYARTMGASTDPEVSQIVSQVFSAIKQ